MSAADFELSNQSSFCSSYYRLNVYLPSPISDLKSEIQRRTASNQPFSNQEFTLLFYQAIYGLAHLQELGFHHNSISPHWIVPTTTGYAIMDNFAGEKQEQTGDLY